MTDTRAFCRTYPEGSTLASWRTLDGWPLRVFDWPVPNGARGAILFQGGRGDIFEKYLEVFAHWHARGWHITSFDWRGQGGSGRFLDDPKIGHCPDFSLWLNDLEHFWADWPRCHQGPKIVMGHSMGGHLVLRALLEKRIDPDAAVLVAPMLGFDSGPLPVSWAAFVLRWLAKGKWRERRAWKTNERPAAGRMSRQSLLTNDRDRYEDELWWKQQKPELAIGPPSIGWLSLAHSSCRLIESAPVESLYLPMTVLGTEGDQLVSPESVKAAAARLPDARVKIFGRDVAHEILRERDGPRDEAIALIDALLDEAMA